MTIGVLTLTTAASARIPQPAAEVLPHVQCSEAQGPAGYRDMNRRFQQESVVFVAAPARDDWPALGTHVPEWRTAGYRDWMLRESPQSPAREPLYATQVVLRCRL